MAQFQGLLGVAALLGLAWLFSANRARVSPRVVLGALLLQFAVAAICLKVPFAVDAFDALARGFTKVISFADAGTRFLFGDLADPSKGPWGFVFVIRVVPVIIFFAALMGVLYHLRVMQVVVAGLAWVLRRALGITGAEALSAAANVFIGQTEAPLTVRPYLAALTRSQIMAVMTGGFATIAGSVMAAYVGMLGGDSDAERILFAKHLLTASVMSAPAGLLMAKVMLPETESPRDETLGTLLQEQRPAANVIDAAAAGATDGVKLAINVAAMLVAFVSLIALLNWPLAQIDPRLSFEGILGVILRPVAWTLGIPWQDSANFGSLMGLQVVATEFVAYARLSQWQAEGVMTHRSREIAIYALCGFANLPSIAIQIGGLSAIVPERRADFVRIAPRAMIAGALACWTTGAIAGLFIPA